MASLNDPETWPRYGELHDKEFSEVLKQNLPRRFPPVELNDLPNVREAWAEGCRKDRLALLALHEEVVSSDELFIPLSNGNSMRCLRFQPKTESSKPRALIWLIHGGGFLFGTAEMEAPACINPVAAHGCVAMSLGYSLAPEPSFLLRTKNAERHYSGLSITQITANEAILGVDLKLGFILGGTSSGGQTTAALSHWARDRGLSPPLTGLYMNSSFTIQPELLPSKFKSIYQGRSLASDGSKSGLDRKTELAFKEAVQPDLSSGLWSPLLWKNGHHALPPTYFQVCGADVLRDDSLVYERTLRMDEGVATKVDVYAGCPHVWWFFHPSIAITQKFHRDTVAGIGWLLGLQR